jgi:L-alanine-DL-glutamate epimerase-like enolase superfamily enzyme
MVLVKLTVGNIQGLGYTYADTSTAILIRDVLQSHIVGADAFSVRTNWEHMVHVIRNLGRPGICSMAIAAVDTAAWDLKARLLNVSLVTLLGAARESVEVYGSGGFTSYTTEQLQSQLSNWVEHGIAAVKMKIGRQPGEDPKRVQAARKSIGPKAALFVDANGAYDLKQALAQAEAFQPLDVSWFEEPVSSDDLEGLRLLRDRCPPSMEIAAGEYGYDLPCFRRLLQAKAVDVLQADATRCGGITGFLQVAHLCDAFGLPLSAHTAPALHLHPCCAAPRLRHLEYFHDHVRMEQALFDGAVLPVNGRLHPNLSVPGLGLALKEADARHYKIA